MFAKSNTLFFPKVFFSLWDGESFRVVKVNSGGLKEEVIFPGAVLFTEAVLGNYNFFWAFYCLFFGQPGEQSLFYEKEN
jgi:hypothetical protein